MIILFIYRFLVFIFFITLSLHLSSFGIDPLTSPEIMYSAGIFLISDTPTAIFYQPAKKNQGISINQSFPYGFGELGTSSFSLYYRDISLGFFVLDNSMISEKISYLGYSICFNNITLGTNLRYYNQAVEGYETLDAFTGNLGVIWQNTIFTHGFIYSNITHSTVKNIELPSIYKYECLINPYEKISFAFSFEKERDFDMRYGFAAKQYIHDLCSIATGYITNPGQFSAGISIMFSKMTISYGIRTHEYLGYTQAVGVNYGF